VYTTTLRRLETDLGDLIARHERARDLRDFSRYRENPVRFIREVLKGEPWDRQGEIAEAVRDESLVVVRSANACGKDWVAAHLALWWVFARRGLVLLTGPTERQVIEIVMGEVGRAFGKAKDLPGELYRTALRLGREEHAGILAFTSTEASKLTGFHAPRVMAILTEAQGCEDFAWEGLLACATGSEDRVLAVGNPLRPSGRFYTVSRPRSGWRAIRIGASEHPNLTEARTVIPGGPSADFCERIAREYGRDSGIYQSRVEGEFPDAGEDSLIRRSWIDAASDRWKQMEAEAEGELVIGVDPARFGPDQTVVAVRRGNVLLELVAWGQCDLAESVERVRGELERAGVKPGSGCGVPVTWADPWSSRRRRHAVGRVVVDEVGVGAGVADRLSELGYNVEPFNGGRSPRDGDRFLNRRAEAYWHLRDLLERGEIALPADEALADELLAQVWRPTSDGKVMLEPKEALRGRIGRSPDRADAVVMAFAEPARPLVAVTFGS